jgi:hypothetical protein
MRIVVCGGRDFTDSRRVFKFLDWMHERKAIAELVEGGAKGADALAGRWAECRGIKRTTVPADWITYGKAAGPIRNEGMLELGPDAVVAFPGGRGTADMVARARRAGIAVIHG